MMKRRRLIDSKTEVDSSWFRSEDEIAGQFDSLKGFSYQSSDG